MVMQTNRRIISVKFNPEILLPGFGIPKNGREIEGMIGRAKTAFLEASAQVRKENLLRCIDDPFNSENRVLLTYSDRKGYAVAVGELRKINGVDEVKLVRR